MSQKTLSILICFFFIYIFFEGAIVELEANEINLPKTIGPCNVSFILELV